MVGAWPLRPSNHQFLVYNVTTSSDDPAEFANTFTDCSACQGMPGAHMRYHLLCLPGAVRRNMVPKSET